MGEASDKKATSPNIGASQVFYPEMMKESKLLILDYDVLRYHSFDLFRYLLLDKENFLNCRAEFLPFIKTTDLNEQILFYMRHMNHIIPQQAFTGSLAEQITTIEAMEDNLNAAMVQKNMKITPTDMGLRLSQICYRTRLDVYILRYAKDPYRLDIPDTVKTFTSDHPLNLNMAIALIQKYQINAVMLSSLDCAMVLCSRLYNMGYRSQLSIIIGTYWYNYDPETKLLRHIEMMNLYEYSLKHEFGIFDPFTGLNVQRRERLQQEVINHVPDRSEYSE